MKVKHITELLDRKGFDALDAAERAAVGEHAAACSGCAAALDASRVASEMLRLDALAETPVPSQFFSQKVLAALRDKQAMRRPMETFRRWWAAAYPMVCTMMLIVAGLAALTVFAPHAGTTPSASGPDGLYTADAVILNQRTPRNLTTEQALEMIYNERPGKR